MLWVEISTDDLDTLARDLREFETRVHDVLPLAREIREDVLTQNMAARMAGVDRDGYPFLPLAESTLRRNPYRGDGPPLDGMGMASRIVSGFEVDVIDMGIGAADVVGSWPSMDEFIIYHITGTRNMPRRDPAGVTPPGWAAIADSFDRWMNTIAGGDDGTT